MITASAFAGSSPAAKALQIAKKGSDLFSAGGNVGTVIDNNMSKPEDTKVTATFADKIISSKGTAIMHTRRDSTVRINKNGVSSFNRQAKLSIQQQEQTVDQLLDNRN